MSAIVVQKVNCKDCHRCVRSCPVKAIGIEKGHNRLIEEKCILCGRCVTECPQQAKQVQNQLNLVEKALENRKKVVFSLAPAFAAAFSERPFENWVNRLREKGVWAVEETAAGAEVVARIYGQMVQGRDKPLLSSCCPVIVSLITKYYPDMKDYLAPVMSPLFVHGTMLREKYGEDALIVFAGPCVAKIAESNETQSEVDVVLTFPVLKEWLSDVSGGENGKGALLPGARKAVRQFSVRGGVIASFREKAEEDEAFMTADGIETCVSVLENLRHGNFRPRFIEMMACVGGCINGPVSGSNCCIPAKRSRVVSFSQGGRESDGPIMDDSIFLRPHQGEPVELWQPSEEKIWDILKKIGKYTVADEKNCGACGYDSCREKAIAVLQGVAEVDMCVPYMRSKAESLSNIIVDNSLNPIIVVDENMTVWELNPAAEAMFQCNREFVRGNRLHSLMDCSDFMAVAGSGQKILNKRVEYPRYGVVTEQSIFAVSEHGLVIGVLIDVTAAEQHNRELAQLKLDTVEKATEIINKQMQVAQEIAGLMGETTAETKTALLELIALLQNKEGGTHGGTARRDRHSSAV